MAIFCAKCGAEQSSQNSYCASCGTKIESLEQLDSKSGQVKIENQESRSDSNQKKGMANYSKIVTGVVAGLVVLGFITSHNSGRDSKEENSPAPVSTSASPTSEFYIFSNKEAVDFWNRNLGINLNQKDRFVGSLFPSLTSKVEIFSAPYYQLLIFPTSEDLAQDQSNFESDVDSQPNRSWATCSNVAFVFPESQLDEITKINDEFCK